MHTVPQAQKIHPRLCVTYCSPYPLRFIYLQPTLSLEKLYLELLCPVNCLSNPPKMLLSVFHPLLPCARLAGLIKGKLLWALVDGWTKTSQRAQWCIQLAGADRRPSCVKLYSFYSLLHWEAKTGNLQSPWWSLKMAIFILNTLGRDYKHWLLWLLPLFLVLQPSVNRTIERQS